MARFHLLGPVNVHIDQGSGCPIPSLRVRALLVALLINHGQYVPLSRLAEYVWTDPPKSTQANIRNHVTALRRSLDGCRPGLGDHLDTRRGGATTEGAYRLAADADDIDAAQFAKLADQGHHELARRRPDIAARSLRTALDLWRGPIGDDLPDTSPLRAWAATLADRRLTAGEDLAEAQLSLGEHAGLVTELRRHVHENPLRERPVELLMRVLDAAGDRTTALTEFRQLQGRLADELGVQPSSRLQHVHHALLSGRLASTGTQALSAANAAGRRVPQAVHRAVRRNRSERGGWHRIR